MTATADAPKQAHVVTDGMVFCPTRRREVDVERCLVCDRLVDADLDSRRPRIVCAALP